MRSRRRWPFVSLVIAPLKGLRGASGAFNVWWALKIPVGLRTPSSGHLSRSLSRFGDHRGACLPRARHVCATGVAPLSRGVASLPDGSRIWRSAHRGPPGCSRVWWAARLSGGPLARPAGRSPRGLPGRSRVSRAAHVSSPGRPRRKTTSARLVPICSKGGAQLVTGAQSVMPIGPPGRGFSGVASDQPGEGLLGPARGSVLLATGRDRRELRAKPHGEVPRAVTGDG